VKQSRRPNANAQQAEDLTTLASKVMSHVTVAMQPPFKTFENALFKEMHCCIDRKQTQLHVCEAESRYVFAC